ncbi:hypothetical protein J6P59_07790 [bacterium]|nr:hypothetical protein [bacterium]
MPFGYSAEVFKNLKSDSSLDESENKQFNVYERIKTKDVDQKINVNDFESISSVIKEDFIPFLKGQDNNKYMDDVRQL